MAELDGGELPVGLRLARQVSASAIAQRSPCRMLEQPDSSANSPGSPAASRSQATSPRGACRPSTQPIAPRTAGHIAVGEALRPR